MSTALCKHAKGNATLGGNVSFLFCVLHDHHLYHDTDAVIFRNSEGTWDPSAWYYLAELTSKFPFDEHITAVILSGSKAYSYSQSGESLP